MIAGTPFFLLALLFPFFGAILLQFLRAFPEKTIYRTAKSVMLIQTAWVFLSLAFPQKFQTHLFVWHDYHFEVLLELDLTAKIFWALATLLGGIVVRFSLIYMHREPGYSRFFSTLFTFLGGVWILAAAGNLDTFLIGWEILGIASFLLIGFYRHRAQPVQNAAMVYSIYRLCDVGLLAGAYLEHSELRGMGFTELMGPLGAQGLAALSDGNLFFISVLLIFASFGKSAQVPFSSWLPRAMEGPTPSSAIFYGALSIHAGALLLLRTYPIWSASQWATNLILVGGAVSALLASGIGRTVSNIKAQIAYSSITQVGIIFIEIAMGWKDLALVHIVSNAFLRCYQLLASPSVVAHLLRVQGTQEAKAREPKPRKNSAFHSTSYAFLMSEAYLQDLARLIFLTLPQRLSGWSIRRPYGSYLIGICVFVLAYAKWDFKIGAAVGLSLALAMDALWDATQGNGFQDTASCRRTFDKTSLSSFTFSISVSMAYPLGWKLGVLELLPFSAGIIFWWVVARVALLGFNRNEVYGPPWVVYPRRSFAAFISVLGLSGFPISTVFFGEDLLLREITNVRPSLAVAFTGIFILNGIALIQNYTRFFFEPNHPQKQ